MRPSQTLALISIGLAIASCSADPQSASGRSSSAGVRFEHRAHERNDGKMMLIVTPVRGVVQDQSIISNEARPMQTVAAPRATTSMVTVP